ncbi:hypothetical protein LTR85_000292 [Meristemomyces frigidus]|nr:hypothetical protein LTR85_000292 [Meristemomyces frigidus]
MVQSKMKTAEITPPPSKRRKLSESRHPAVMSFQDLTVYSWNVNGIQPFLQRSITSFFDANRESDSQPDAAKASLRDFLRRHDWPTVLFLQEVKVSPEDAATVGAVERAVRANPSDMSSEPDYVAYFCLPSDKFNARGFGRKVYGVCSIIRKDIADEHVERVRAVDWDQEGRFLIVETKDHGHWPKLALINAYMVRVLLTPNALLPFADSLPRNKVNGTDNPYKNTVTGEVTGTRHDRKREVHRLLAAECRELHADGFGIILAGDMNVARSAQDGHPNLRVFPAQHCLNRADFEARFFSKPAINEVSDDDTVEPEPKRDDDRSAAGLGMIDTFRHLHPIKEGYTYYPRSKVFGESCDRVDMIMLSASLKDELTEAGMHETPGDRGPSDHCPLFARFAFRRSNRDDAGGE